MWPDLIYPIAFVSGLCLALAVADALVGWWWNR